ncbi:MAG TPA: cupin domain-containing protein [Burkholderiales bacterium]|nr:cupin domain-containing protein [Burkholderiales bacterium]
MAAMTPDWEGEGGLKPLASRYVDMDVLPWRKTAFPGVEVKVLMEDKASGLLTSLTRMAPGAVLPRHEHVEIEQTYVIEGRLVDAEGEVKAGEYVWRPAGSVHVATAPEGALLLGVFLRPNRFL